MKKNKGRRPVSGKPQTEYLTGINSVTEALRANRRQIREIIIVKGKSPDRFSESLKIAGKLRIPVNYVSFSELTALTGSEAHQSIAAKTTPFPVSDLSGLTGDGKNGLIVILDSIEDPQNLGAIARTSLCAGVDGIILPKDRSVSPVPSASKASAGAMEHLKIATVTNLSSAIKELKKKGYWIAGLDADTDSTLYEADLTVPLGIVIGGEDRGLRDLVRKQCDFILSIPLKTGFNSLNASVAGALAIYEALRQREIS